MVRMARMASEAMRPAGVQFFLEHLAEGFAVAPEGAEEDDHVLHGAAEHDADEDPEGAGEIAELGGEDGADERAGAGDGGEVVAENDPFIGAAIVAAVGAGFAGGGAAAIEGEDAGGEPAGIEAVADGVGAEGGGEEGRGIDGLGALGGNREIGPGPEEGEEAPQELAGNFFHG